MTSRAIGNDIQPIKDMKSIEYQEIYLSKVLHLKDIYHKFQAAYFHSNDILQMLDSLIIMYME